ncbi:MAG: sporulation integral membrane protein YtvI [Peptostreptococcaceae bacterium]|nr:sporulation integral membrane protein YtvI [Peptostreptococcaceae bacterium]
MNPFLLKYLKIGLNLLIWSVSILLIFYGLPRLIVFFMPFCIGWIIAVIANPIIRFLERKLHIVRKHGSALLIAAVLFAILSLAYLLLMLIVVQSLKWVKTLPQIYGQMNADLSVIGEKFSLFFDNFPEEIQVQIRQSLREMSVVIPRSLGRFGEDILYRAGNLAKNIPLALLYIIITILSAYFILIGEKRVPDFVLKIVERPQIRSLRTHLKTGLQIIGGYFKAQFKIMWVVSLILLIGFLWLRIRYALLLSVSIALLDFLPFFGTGFVLLPWVFIKLLSGHYETAAGLFAIYLISQLVRQLIQPKILGDTIGLSPLKTLFFLFVGFRLGGFLGMIFAVPIGMILIQLYQEGFFEPVKRTLWSIAEDIDRFRRME